MRGKKSSDGSATVYISMSLLRNMHGFTSLREFADARKEPLSPDKHGAQRPGFRYNLPEFKHFVLLLPPANAPATEVRRVCGSVCGVVFVLPRESS